MEAALKGQKQKIEKSWNDKKCMSWLLCSIFLWKIKAKSDMIRVLNDNCRRRELVDDLYDVVYICGGDSNYLMKRINECGFDQKLLAYINRGGIVVGVSAGSMIFANDMPENLSILKCALNVHCSIETCEKTGNYSINRQETIKLGNTQAIIFGEGCIEIIE